MAGDRLDVLIRANTRQLEAGFRRVGKQTRDLEKKLRRDFGLMEKHSNRADRSLSRFGRRFIKAAGALIAIHTLVRVSRHLQQMADEYTELNNRLRIVTINETQLANVRERLLDIGARTASSIHQNAVQYSRLALATDKLGIGQNEVLQIVETLNKQVQIGGSTTREAMQGLIQFTQAMAKGKLDGDELRAVSEGLLGVYTGLIKGFDKLRKAGVIDFTVTKKNLRDLARQGKVTADLLAQSILVMKDDTDKQFENIEFTLSRSFEVIKNEGVAMIGALDKAYGASRFFREVFLKTAEWLKTERQQNLSPLTYGGQSIPSLQEALRVQKLLVETSKEGGADLGLNIADLDAIEQRLEHIQKLWDEAIAPGLRMDDETFAVAEKRIRATAKEHEGWVDAQKELYAGQVRENALQMDALDIIRQIRHEKKQQAKQDEDERIRQSKYLEQFPFYNAGTKHRSDAASEETQTTSMLRFSKAADVFALSSKTAAEQYQTYLDKIATAKEGGFYTRNIGETDADGNSRERFDYEHYNKDVNYAADLYEKAKKRETAALGKELVKRKKLHEQNFDAIDAILKRAEQYRQEQLTAEQVRDLDLGRIESGRHRGRFDAQGPGGEAYTNEKAIYDAKAQVTREYWERRTEEETEAREKLTAAAKKASDEINKYEVMLADNFETAFQDIITGTESVSDAFKTMATAVIRELVRMQFSQPIAEGLAGFIGAGFGKFFGGGGGVAPPPGAGPGIGHGGPGVGHASGGQYHAGRPMLVGEHGREIVVPSTSGRVLSHGQAMRAAQGMGGGRGGESVIVNQSINLSVGVSQTVRAEVLAMMPQIAGASRDAIVDERRRGGQVATAFGG